MIGLLSIVSAFETDLRAERQADGIKSAQARGVKFGAKPVFDPERTKAAILRQQARGNQSGHSRRVWYR